MSPPFEPAGPSSFTSRRRWPGVAPVLTTLALGLPGIAAASDEAGPLAPAAPPGFDYRGLEADVIRETQALRRDPAGWAGHLEARRRDYDGDIRHEHDGTRLWVEEGVAALDEAVAVLQAADRLPRLAPSGLLARAAAGHAHDLGVHDATGHAGSDGSDPHARIGRVAEITGMTAENISFGPRTGRDVLMALVIDDGVPDRGHRDILLTPELFQIGVACGPHPSYGVVCVMNLAGGVINRDEDAVEPEVHATPGAPPADGDGPVTGVQTVDPAPGWSDAGRAPGEADEPDPMTPDDTRSPVDPHPDAEARWRPIRRPLWTAAARGPERSGCRTRGTRTRGWR